MSDVIVVIGAGLIGQAIARRVGVAKHIVLAVVRAENAHAAAQVLGDAGYDLSVAIAGVAGHDPPRRPLWYGSSARGIRQRHRSRRIGRGDLVTVRTQASTALRRAEPGTRHDANGRASRTSISSARQGERLVARVPAFQASEL